MSTLLRVMALVFFLSAFASPVAGQQSAPDEVESLAGSAAA